MGLRRLGQVENSNIETEVNGKAEQIEELHQNRL